MSLENISDPIVRAYFKGQCNSGGAGGAMNPTIADGSAVYSMHPNQLNDKVEVEGMFFIRAGDFVQPAYDTSRNAGMMVILVDEDAKFYRFCLDPDPENPVELFINIEEGQFQILSEGTAVALGFNDALAAETGIFDRGGLYLNLGNIVFGMWQIILNMA